MRTFKRYVYRILIPVVVVSLIGLGVRLAMVRDFTETNVRFADTSGLDEQRASRMEFSEDNRDELVASLRRSKTVLDRSLKAEEDRLSEAQRSAVGDKERRLEESIEKLATATESNWNQRRSEALDRLRAYARSVEPQGAATS